MHPAAARKMAGIRLAGGRVRQQQDPYTSVLQAAPQLAQVDISDENRMAPDGKHFDFPALFKGLKEIGYKDYLVFEFHPSPPDAV